MVAALGGLLLLVFGGDGSGEDDGGSPPADPTEPGRVDVQLGGDPPAEHPTKEAGEVKPPPPPPDPVPPPRVHLVEKGDTLRGLARRYYDDPERWTDIQRANDIEGTLITPGQKLTIPR